MRFYEKNDTLGVGDPVFEFAGLFAAYASFKG